ncbi:hypothetical protein DINM_002429 [Dirofilaria immitis]|nr:hypothetical protein [Dirofilaria immitis]
MAGFIEGIGDEVKETDALEYIKNHAIQVIWFLIAAIVIVLMTLAWISTGIPPVDYYVWLVQMQIHPNRRIVQVLQVDNQEINIFRDRPEGRPFAAVTEQALEALMDSDIQNNTSQEVALPQAIEMAQRQISESTLLHAQEISQTEQAINSTESTENFLHASCINNNWQQRADLSASASVGPNNMDVECMENEEYCVVMSLHSVNRNVICGIIVVVENGKNSLVVAKRELSSVVTDSFCQITAGMEGNSAEHQLSNVKLKFLDDSQIIACTALESTVGQFKRRYFWESILAGKIVRLIYQGQLLRDDTRSLLSYGLHDQCVVHCHVTSTSYAQPSSTPNTSNNTVLLHESSDRSNGIAAGTIAAIAGSQSVPANTADELTRTIIQTFRSHSIEDSQNEPILIRIQNTFLGIFRFGYNAVMGSDPGIAAIESTSLDAAADVTANNGWNQNENAIGGRIGQYVQIIFIVKFLVIWTFVFLYPQYTDQFSLLLLTFLSMFFVSVIFSNAHRANSNGMQTQI